MFAATNERLWLGQRVDNPAKESDFGPPCKARVIKFKGKKIVEQERLWQSKKLTRAVGFVADVCTTVIIIVGLL